MPVANTVAKAADIPTEVRRILVELLGIEPAKVTDDAMLVGDLGADSLDVVEIAMELEDAFQIEIPDASAEKFVTVGDVVAYLRQWVPA
jgi:acyl carrier protein